MRWSIVVLVLLVAVFARSTAGAQLIISFTIGIGSVELDVEEDGSVDLRMTAVDHEPVGAWQVDVTFDSTIVSLESCTPVAENTVCDLERAPNTVRVVGASVTGITQDTTLGILNFRCEEEGVSALTLAVVGGSAIPEDIVEIEIRDGAISCSEAAATPAPTAALPTPELPTTGTNRENVGELDKIVWVLAGTGILAAMASGAASLRRRG